MKNPQQDLKEIKQIMERSTRFLSLSGISGILAGIYGLVAAALAYIWIYYPNLPTGYRSLYVNDSAVLIKLGITALLALALSFATGFLFSYRNAKKQGVNLWSKSSKRFFEALMLPLLVGGIFIVAMIARGNLGIVSPACLIFYGLALINASNFTLGDIKYLGIMQVSLGLAAAFLPGYGLIIWALGFGLLHIFYGTLIFLKHEK